ncbi:hypothetical protein D3C77_546740 [compost metagenome]
MPLHLNQAGNPAADSCTPGDNQPASEATDGNGHGANCTTPAFPSRPGVPAASAAPADPAYQALDPPAEAGDHPPAWEIVDFAIRKTRGTDSGKDPGEPPAVPDLAHRRTD